MPSVPHAIIMVGIPGAGKTAFSTRFADTFGTPYSLCRPERLNSHGDLVATTASIIMRPGDGVMEVARTPYKSAEYVQYSI